MASTPTKLLRPKDRDPAVEAVIATNTGNEPAQIDDIAKIRRWFCGDDFPTDVVNKYLSGSLNVQETADRLASPVDKSYTTANGGRALVTAEKSARSQRTYYKTGSINAGRDVIADWGPEEDISKFEVTEPDTAPTAELQLWNLYYAILHAAKKTPSEQQGKLVDLVRTLKSRPDPKPPANITRALRRDWVWQKDELWS